jgi:hypothetical protein
VIFGVFGVDQGAVVQSKWGRYRNCNFMGTNFSVGVGSSKWRRYRKCNFMGMDFSVGERVGQAGQFCYLMLKLFVVPTSHQINVILIVCNLSLCFSKQKSSTANPQFRKLFQHGSAH